PGLGSNASRGERAIPFRATQTLASGHLSIALYAVRALRRVQCRYFLLRRIWAFRRDIASNATQSCDDFPEDEKSSLVITILPSSRTGHLMHQQEHSVAPFARA